MKRGKKYGKTGFDELAELFHKVGRSPCEEMGGCTEQKQCAKFKLGCDAYKYWIRSPKGTVNGIRFIKFRGQNMNPLSDSEKEFTKMFGGKNGSKPPVIAIEDCPLCGDKRIVRGYN